MKSKYQGLVAKKAGIPAPFLIKSLAWMAQKSLFFHLLLMTIVLLLSAWLVFEPLVFANSDVGLRFIQIRSLVEQGWNTLAIPYPTEIDPGFNFSPYYYAYSLLDGRLYFNISPFFPLASSFFYRVLGNFGLTIVPVSGSLLTALGVYQLAQLARLKRPFLVMWCAVLGTPILFYNAQLWDHTIGSGLAVLGMAMAARGLVKGRNRPVIFGGGLLGFSLGQRPELYMFVIALGLAWLILNWRRRPLLWALAAGGVVGALPVWLLQWRWVGHPLGMAMATNLLGYGLPDTYPVVIDGYPRSVVVGHFLFHIEARNILTFGAVLAVLAGILLFVFFLRVPRYQKKSVLWLAAACTFFGYTVWAIIAWRDMVTGLVSTMPLLGFSLAYVNAGADNSDSHTVYQFAWYTVMIYLAGMLSFWPAFGAKLWGSRYLLSAYPLLLFLAFYAVAAYHSRLPALLQKTLHLTFWLLLVIAVGLQFLGWRFNYVTIQALAAERDAVQALPADVVLTNLPFWSPLMSSIDDRPFFYIETDSEIDSLLRRLYAHGWRRIAVISLESEPLTLANDVDGLEIRRISPFIYQLQSH